MRDSPGFEWEPELIDRDPSALRPVARATGRRGSGYHEFVQYRFRAPVAGAAGGLPGERGDADRRSADLRRARQRRRVGTPRAFLPRRAGSAAGRRRGSAGLLQRDRAATGATRSIAGMPTPRTTTRGGLPGFASCSSGSTSSGSIISAGFEAYWEIPAGSPTAASGKWVPAPGSEFFEALRRRLGQLP